MKVRFKTTFNTFWIVVALLLSLSAYAKGPTLAVLYPDVREPYRSIFGDILKGIKKDASGKVKSFALRQGEDLDKLNKWLENTKPDAVISLGNRGKGVIQHLSPELKIIAGATILSNQNIEKGFVGISLTPSPRKLFVKLLQLAPQVKRISVVYHAETNGWLIKLARQAAESLSIDLVAIAAYNVREAAFTYKRLLAEQENGFDAIWLLQGDPTLDERGLLPTILSEAWGNQSVVFSSNPSHVKRGALFSLFPDNLNMGKSLSQKAKSIVNGKNNNVEALKDLLIAVNVRTAEHLNLKISRSEQRNFDLIFPNR